MTTDDPFFQVYDRDDIAFGLEASAELASYIAQVQPIGLAIDLGAGAGRNALALAKAGMRVKAVDISQRGLDRLIERARSMNIGDRIETQVADVRDVVLRPGEATVVVATTVLDHIPSVDIPDVWARVEGCLTSEGVVYAEVHTTEDPGCNEAPGCHNTFPISETASELKHYFRAGELLRLAMMSSALRVLRYEERQEWDYTHGAPHHHGKAVLLAVRAAYYPAWYGHPLAFPRR